MDAFESAKTSFLDSLDSQEVASLGPLQTAEDVLTEVEKAEEEHRRKSMTRKYMTNLQHFVKGVEHYGKALDVFANAKPELLSLIWGAARLILHAAIEYIDFFERLTDMFRRLGKSLGRFGIYARLYPDSDRLRLALIVAYEKFLQLCLQSKSLFKETQAKRLKWLSTTSATMGIKLLWKPIKRQIEETLDDLDELFEDVEKDADVAEKESSAEARVEINKISSHISTQRTRQIIEWLEPVDPSINHTNAIRLHEMGTGDWVFDDGIYKAWESQGKATLWLHAKPGGGKTILASTIIEHINHLFGNHSNIVVSYFYCDYRDISKRTTQKVLQTIIAAISRQSPDALAYVDEISSKYREFKSPCTLETLYSILEKCLSFQTRNFIIIDALDECNDREELLKFVVDLSSSSPKLNLLVTSRKEKDIQRELQHLPQLMLVGENTSQDIEVFVKTSLDSMIKNKNLKIRDESIREEIFESLCSGADGMFQWVKCQLDTLGTLITDKSIRAALKQLPNGLDETYIRAFSIIRNQMGDDAIMVKRLFWWLIHALRPLTLRELSEAIGIEIRQPKMDFSAVPTDPEDIIDFCGGLVTVSRGEKEDTVNLSHFSVKEFLLSPRVKGTSVAEFYAGPSTISYITSTCLTYLMMEDFKDGQCLEKTKFSRRKQTYTFMEYAAHYWANHCKSISSESSSEHEELAFELLTDPSMSGNLESWSQVSTEVEDRFIPCFEIFKWGNSVEEPLNLVTECTPPMYHACRLGLTGLVKRLVRAGYDMDARSGGSNAEHRYPILASAFNQHWDVVEALVESGASIHVYNDGTLLNALAETLTAATWGLFTRVLDQGGLQLLNKSKRRADSSSWCNDVLDALALLPSDSWEMVELLIREGAGVNSSTKFRQTEIETDREPVSAGGPPLQLAAFQGNKKVIESLIKAGANLSFSFCELGSPIQAAVRGNRKETLLQLLEYGADINLEGGALGTPLQAAAWNGNLELLNFLLRGGAKVNSGGGLYGGALSAAIHQKHTDIVETLLRSGADVNTFYDRFSPPHQQAYVFHGRHQVIYGRVMVDSFGESPLQYAIMIQDLSMVTLLLDAGATILQENVRCFYGTHSLCQSITLQNLEMVNLLLHRGASPLVGDCCALITAASKSDFSIFRVLFDKVGKKSSGFGSVVCDIITQVSNEPFAQELIQLLENEVVISPDMSHKAAYLVSATVSVGCFTLTRFLLEKGFNPNIQRVPGMGYGKSYSQGVPLPQSIRERRFDLANMLLDHGASSGIGDDFSGSPLYAAVKVQNLELVSRLLKLGASPNEDVWTNDDYCSKVIHIASTYKDLAILDELVKHGADVNSSCPRCKSTLMAAIRAQQVEAMEILFRHGANVSDPDMFGRMPLSRARDNHLELAIDKLLEFGAEEHLPPAEVRLCLERTLKDLAWRLLQLLEHAAEQDFAGCEWMPWTLWLDLGRSLILIGDFDNGIKALEQVFYRGGKDRQQGWKWHSWIRCCYCDVHDENLFHLCEDCDTGMFCDGCMTRHGILFKHSRFGHAVTDFPRDLLRDVPKGQVVSEDGSRMSDKEWLQGLYDQWTLK